jgi:hypothetical protein
MGAYHPGIDESDRSGRGSALELEGMPQSRSILKSIPGCVTLGRAKQCLKGYNYILSERIDKRYEKEVVDSSLSSDYNYFNSRDCYFFLAKEV